MKAGESPSFSAQEGGRTDVGGTCQKAPPRGQPACDLNEKGQVVQEMILS